MLSHVPRVDYGPRAIAELDDAPLSSASVFSLKSSSSLISVLDNVHEESLKVSFEPTPFQDGAYLQALPDSRDIFVPTTNETNPSMIHPHGNYFQQCWKTALVQSTHLSSSMQDGDVTHSTHRATTPEPKNSKNHVVQYQQDLWDEHYHELLRYKKKHGDCYIPQNYPEDFALARWVRRQRHQYKRKRQNKSSTMSDKRQRLLEEAGFIWDPQTDVWEMRFQELQEYKRRHGDCNVPSRYAENPQLATWVKRQRRQYKQMQKGMAMRLPLERFAKLDNMGFEWKLRNEPSRRN